MEKEKAFVADVLVLLQRGNDFKTTVKVKKNCPFSFTANYSSLIASYKESEDFAAKMCIDAKNKELEYMYCSISLN